MAVEPEPVGALISHCAGLPLALGVVAARAMIHPELPLAALAKELRDTSTRLDALDAGELAVNLRAVLSSSCDALGPDAAQVFALLGLAPGPDISLAAVASLINRPAPRARALVGELINANLVHEDTPGRYRMHDLVRLYAGERGRDPEDRWRMATHRVLDHYLHTAYAANEALSPNRDAIPLAPPQPGVVPEPITDHATALAWFTVEQRVLVPAVDHAAQTGFDRHAWQLAWTLIMFFNRRQHWLDLTGTQRTALRAAERLGDPLAQTHAHRGLGHAHIGLRRFGDAHAHLRRALELSATIDDPACQAHVHRSLGRLFARQDRFREALPYDERALELYEAAGNRVGLANTLNAVGWHLAHLGEHQRALGYCERALTLYQQLGDRYGQAITWDSLGYARHHLGHHPTAIDCYQRALDLIRELGHRNLEGEALADLADTHHAAGADDAARDGWRRALRIFEELGHPGAGAVRAKLARCDPA
jgi:tetratricopeptide (TPR) repeat protein